MDPEESEWERIQREWVDKAWRIACEKELVELHRLLARYERLEAATRPRLDESGYLK